MPYDLFISYSRRDNEQGRITQLVERIKADFANFEGNNGRELHPFFDQQEIHGMSDWRQRILQGLRESRLLLACLSPAYLKSEYCEWEFVEYLKYEIGHLHGFNGVAPIYFVEVPGWNDKGFEQQCAAWVAELRRRQNFDLRPWHDLGEAALRETAVQERMGKLNRQIVQTITRGERAEKSLGNVDAHNPHFIGRTANLRLLRENFVTPGHIGVVTAVNGVGGLGKTALAIEYAHAFADEYGGGRWQVRCAGKDDLRLALAELATPLGFEFTHDERKSANLQLDRVRRELKKLADAHEPPRCLLLFDNVERPSLLDPAHVARLNAGDWLHILVTTRLGESELHGTHHDRSFLAIDELPPDDALALMESYMPRGCFRSEAERDVAREIVRLLDGFTLAVESAAVYLGQYANDVTCAGFLARLKKSGLAGLDAAADQSSEAVLHGEKRLGATLQPTLERLGVAAKLALEIVAQQASSDRIQLASLRDLVAETIPEIARDAEPGYPDPWIDVLYRLFSLRLIQTTDSHGIDHQPKFVRVHRLVQEFVRSKQRESTKKRRVWGRLIQVCLIVGCVVVAVLVTGWYQSRNLGVLHLTSDPEEATVRVSGNILGKTPYDSFLPQGTWKVEIAKEGFVTREMEVHIAKGVKGEYAVGLASIAGDSETNTTIASESGTIVEIENIVQVCPAKSHQWVAAQKNMLLHTGDRVRTRARSRATIKLSGLYYLRMEQLTTFEMTPIEKPGFLDLTRGALFIFSGDQTKGLELETPAANGILRG